MSFLKIAFVAGNALKKYGALLPQIRNSKVTAAYLGKSLRELRQAWEDTESGTFFTLYESVEKIIEIKMLMHITAANMGIKTYGRSQHDILTDIINQHESTGHTGCVREIKDTMTWTQMFFSRPEVQEIFKESSIDIKFPNLTKPKEILTFAKSLVTRISQEADRVHKVISLAKDTPSNGDKKQGSQKPRPKPHKPK